MTFKEIYGYFLQARELLLQTYDDYPYGEDWSEGDKAKFEQALASYTNYYMAAKDYLDQHPELQWSDEESKKRFISYTRQRGLLFQAIGRSHR